MYKQISPAISEIANANESLADLVVKHAQTVVWNVAGLFHTVVMQQDDPDTLFEQLAGISDDPTEVVEALLDAGATPDQVAGAIWGEGMTWELVCKIQSRPIAETIHLWQAAGYDIIEADSFCRAATKVVNGVLFMATNAELNELPQPEFPCCIGAYEPDSMEYLDFMVSDLNMTAADQRLVTWAEQVNSNEFADPAPA
jgi:hypothetical protein